MSHPIGQDGRMVEGPKIVPPSYEFDARSAKDNPAGGDLRMGRGWVCWGQCRMVVEKTGALKVIGQI